MNSIGSEFLWGNKAKNRTCNATQMVDRLAVIRFFHKSVNRRKEFLSRRYKANVYTKLNIKAILKPFQLSNRASRNHGFDALS